MSLGSSLNAPPMPAAPLEAPPRHRLMATFLPLALVVAYPLFGWLLVSTVLPALRPAGQLLVDLVNETVAWSYMLLALGLMLRGGRRPAALIGLGRPGWWTLGLGIVAAIATVLLSNVTASVTYGLLGRAPPSNAAAAAMTHGSVAYAVLLALRAGVVEEVLYRGIAIELLTELTGLRWAAAAVSLLLFVVPHAIVFDWAQLVPIAAAGLVMTLLYLWRRDLWANMLAHSLVDAFGLVLLTLGASG